MNILTDELPLAVAVGNSVIDINTDFRASIEFERMAERGGTDIEALLKPYFPGQLPDNIEDAVTAALYIYRCGAEPTEEKKEKGENKRAYSFDVDSEAIYSDFWRFYKIDLSEGYLHWWKFRALLAGLPEDSAFKERIYYRTCSLKDLPKKERERIGKIRKAIEIKSEEKRTKTLEERNAQMLRYVAKRNKDIESGVKT